MLERVRLPPAKEFPGEQLIVLAVGNTKAGEV